jgi:hypothetical protein
MTYADPIELMDAFEEYQAFVDSLEEYHASLDSPEDSTH